MYVAVKPADKEAETAMQDEATNDTTPHPYDQEAHALAEQWGLGGRAEAAEPATPTAASSPDAGPAAPAEAPPAMTKADRVRAILEASTALHKLPKDSPKRADLQRRIRALGGDDGADIKL
jgi:hypothetical protein